MSLAFQFGTEGARSWVRYVVNSMSETVYRWRVYDTTSPWKKKGGWRELTWATSEPDALAWAKKEGFVRIEKLEGSEKTYSDVDRRQSPSS